MLLLAADTQQQALVEDVPSALAACHAYPLLWLAAAAHYHLLVAARPGALLALLVSSLQPLTRAQRSVGALEHPALVCALPLLRYASVVLVVSRVAVPRLQPAHGI